MPRYDNLMDQLGYDKDNYTTVGNSPAAWGNRIALTYLWHGLNDGSNEAGDYENTFYVPVNDPLVMGLSGNPDLQDPGRWQPLTLEFFKDQSGNIIPGDTPDFLGPEWGYVTGFAITPEDITFHEREGYIWPVAHDPGPPAYLGTETDWEYKRGVEQVAIWSSHCTPADGVMWDISPNSIGNAELPSSMAEWESFYDVIDGGE